MKVQPAVHLRPATDADLPFLLALRRLTMDPHHAEMGIVQTAEEQEARVRSHFDSAQVIEWGGDPVGLWKVLRDPAGWRLAQVQILPSHQRAGIGARLVAGLVADGRAAGVPVVLSVLKRNPARRLYERCGFVVVDEGELSYEMRA